MAKGRKWQPTPVFLPGESHGQREMTLNSKWQWVRVNLEKVKGKGNCQK